MNFEFDPAKSQANLAKHGIDFVGAQALWRDDRRVVAPSRQPGEPRQLVIGQIAGKLWTVIITPRGGNLRIISVRRARANEERVYESQTD